MNHGALRVAARDAPSGILADLVSVATSVFADVRCLMTSYF